MRIFKYVNNLLSDIEANTRIFQIRLSKKNACIQIEQKYNYIKNGSFGEWTSYAKDFPKVQTKSIDITPTPK